jgi:competence protein ComEC
VRRLAIFSFSFTAAIVVTHYVLPFEAGIFCALGFAVLALAGLALRAPLRTRVFLALFGLAFGFLWNTAWNALYFTPAEALAGRTAAVRAVVLDYPAAITRGQRVNVKILQDGRASVKASVLWFGEERALQPGDEIAFTGDFALADEIRGEKTDVYTSRGYFLSAKLLGDIEPSGRAAPVLYFPARLKHAVCGIVSEIFPADTAPFMRALLMGDTGELREDSALSAALGAAGVSHVVAVSGMHISFLLGLCALITKRKKLLAAISIPVLLVFMAVLGFTPSVMRAGVMQLLLMLAPLLRRENDSLTSLSAALFLLLLQNPNAIASVSLQLSFASVLGIMLVANKMDFAIENALRDSALYARKATKAALHFIFASLSTTAGALCFTTPLMALYFGYISLVAPLSNLAILWAVSLSFCGGMLAVALGALLPALGAFAALLVSLPVRYIIYTVKLLAGAPLAALYISNAYVLIWLTYVYALIISLTALRARARKAVLPVCLGTAALCAVLLVTYIIPSPGELSITALDIGQGQSLVFCSGSATAMVDCGSSSGEKAGDVACEYLSGNGRLRVDLLILTHYDADHINGVAELLTRMDVTAVAIPDPDYGEGGWAAEEIIEACRKRKVQVIYVTEVLELPFNEGAVKIFPPLSGGEGTNERGLTILFTDGDYDILVTGDMNAETERRLIDTYELPDIEVLVAGHHGSRYSTSAELLDTVTPEAAIISCGRHNSYGHPAKDTLGRLRDRGIDVYRTDEQGTITINEGVYHAR